MIGLLGTVIFTVSTEKVLTFDDFKRDGSARWATHEVHGIKPVSEFIGPGLDQISLTIRLDASLGVSPKMQIDTLRDYRDTGQVIPLVIGDAPVGNGKYTVQSISEDWTRIDGRGFLVAAVLSIQLQEYAETAVITAAARTKARAAAKNPVKLAKATSKVVKSKTKIKKISGMGDLRRLET